MGPTSFEIQQEPTIAKVKVRIITILVHQFENVSIKYLYQRSHVGEMVVHCTALRKVGDHSLHQFAKAAVREYLCGKKSVN